MLKAHALALVATLLGQASGQSLVEVLPTSEMVPRTWRYTLERPPARWHEESFDDTAWRSGTAPFGTNRGLAGERFSTRWATPDIWLRTTFTPGGLSREERDTLYLKVNHDEDIQIYINGVLAAYPTGYTRDYELLEIRDVARGALVAREPAVIAVHCHQTVGGQFIDLGIVQRQPDVVQRTRLLAPYMDRIKRIVFTKHFDMGGSHYAYTDAVSDEDVLNPGNPIKEFNFKGGSSLCLLEIAADFTTEETTLLEDPDGVFRDPDVSYDGTRILFSWKKSATGDDYHLYEMDAATRKVCQLTSGLGFADYEGIYLPNGDIMCSSTRCVQNVDCWHVSVCNMYLMNKDGRFLRRIGFDQVHTNYPQVHPETGLVTYTRWEYNDRGQIYPQPLFRMFPNGTQQTEFYGNNSYFPTTILHARGIPGSGKVLAVLSGHHTHQRGKLAIIDPARGRQETRGVTLVAPPRVLKGVIKIDQYGQRGDQWQYPYPLDEDNYLVTFRPQGERHFGIYFMNRQGERVLLASDPTISCNQPVPLAPRALPPQPAYPTDWRKTTGVFTLQDIYRGPGLKGVPRGTVKKLRVVALEFMATDIGRKHGPSTISDLAAWDVKNVLGETPVHEDGSAAFEVPARTPVYFQAIDGQGQVVQTMRSWSTLMPGEHFSCIGCHEDKNKAVANQPQTMALRAGIQPLEPFYDASGKGFSFPEVIQPIFDAKCATCHDGSTPPDLRRIPVWDEAARKFWNMAYHVLVSTDRPAGPANDTSQRLGVVAERSRYLNWIGRWSVPTLIPPYSHGSSQSPLLSLLRSGHEGVTMTREELDKICCWIDLAVPHSGDWTEGMTDEDRQQYMKVYRKRLAWQQKEAAHLQEYLDHLTASGQSSR